MKKFKYYGREVEVPDYATHIAVDADGEGWWYMNKVIPNNMLKKWKITACHDGSKDNCGRIGYFANVDNWKGSLRSC